MERIRKTKNKQMIEYYYHPILGLQYFYHEPTLVIGMCRMPERAVLDKFLYNWKDLVINHGIEPTYAITTKIISNFK